MARKGRNGRYIGQPPGLNAEVETKFLRAVEDGMPLKWAAVNTGISYAALHRWMIAGEKAQDVQDAGGKLDSRDKLYREFRAKVLKARSQVARTNIHVINKAAEGGYITSERTYTDETGQEVTERTFAGPQWGAAKFMLQTSFQSDFTTNTRSQVEISGPDQGPIQVTDARATELASRVTEILARRELEAQHDATIIEGETVEG